MVIPTNIHQIWIQGEDHYRENRPNLYERSEENQKMFPSWTYKMWSGEDIESLLKEHYPDLLELYEKGPNLAYKSDIGRQAILYHFGGVYMDVDYMVIRDMSYLFSGDIDALVVQSDNFNLSEKIMMRFEYNNCFIASAVNGKLISEWSKLAKQYGPYKRGNKVQYTISASLSTFNEACKTFIHDESVRIISNSILEPVNMKNMHKACNSREECAEAFPAACGIHTNDGSWLDGAPAVIAFGKMYGAMSEVWLFILIALVIVIVALSISTHMYRVRRL